MPSPMTAFVGSEVEEVTALRTLIPLTGANKAAFRPTKNNSQRIVDTAVQTILTSDDYGMIKAAVRKIIHPNHAWADRVTDRRIQYSETFLAAMERKQPATPRPQQPATPITTTISSSPETTPTLTPRVTNATQSNQYEILSVDTNADEEEATPEAQRQVEAAQQATQESTTRPMFSKAIPYDPEDSLQDDTSSFFNMDEDSQTDPPQEEAQDLPTQTKDPVLQLAGQINADVLQDSIMLQVRDEIKITREFFMERLNEMEATLNSRIDTMEAGWQKSIERFTHNKVTLYHQLEDAERTTKLLDDRSEKARKAYKDLYTISKAYQGSIDKFKEVKDNGLMDVTKLFDECQKDFQQRSKVSVEASLHLLEQQTKKLTEDCLDNADKEVTQQTEHQVDLMMEEWRRFKEEEQIPAPIQATVRKQATNILLKAYDDVKDTIDERMRESAKKQLEQAETDAHWEERVLEYHCANYHSTLEEARKEVAEETQWHINLLDGPDM